MARYRRYIDMDVLTAAQKRMRHLYQIHDHVVVAFSGGKDSLAVLELAREAAEAEGKLPVKVLFYDEELIPDSVLNTVDHYRKQPWCDLKWVVFPLESNKFILGKSYRYIQWDPDRKWLREPPAWGIRPEPGEIPHGTLSQYEVSAVVSNRWYPGKVSMALGLRASESLLRLRSCLGSRGHAWMVSAHNNGRVASSRPIYDWNENDVLKFIMERKLYYSPLYDAQHLAGNSLRVSTPLHSEAAKKFHYWRAIEPVFYQQIVDLFPEMQVQERYWREFDRDAMFDKYTMDGWEGIERYINDTAEDPAQRMLAFKRLGEIKDRARLKPDQFTVEGALRYFLGGTLKRAMMGQMTTGGKAKPLSKSAARRAAARLHTAGGMADELPQDMVDIDPSELVDAETAEDADETAELTE